MKAGVGKDIVTFNDVKESVAIFAYFFSMLIVIRVCLQSTRERASGSSVSDDSARGMEFLYHHLLSPRYGVPICSARGMEFLCYHLLSPRYGVPICSARGTVFLYYHLPSRGMEFLYYHLLSPRYGVPLLQFAFYV